MFSHKRIAGSVCIGVLTILFLAQVIIAGELLEPMADAGPDMGHYNTDSVRYIVSGKEVILDGSASTPVAPETPIVEYKWAWEYDGAVYSVTSPNDFTTAQFIAIYDGYFIDMIWPPFPYVVVKEDYLVTLTVTDSLERSGSDTAEIRVSSPIPGDINEDGCVNLSDFVILRNNF